MTEADGAAQRAGPPALADAVLRVVALGGIKEIGRNMTMFEHRLDPDGSRLLVVDCGMLLGKTNSPGVDLTLPDWSYFRDRLADIDAVVLTHGHEDHIGALPYLLRERADIPIIGSRLTLALVAAKLDQHQHPTATCGRSARARRRPSGHGVCEFYAVNHSIPDALAVAIRVGDQTVLHTGDFKMDQTPLDGRLTDLPGFSRLGDEGVDLLLADSTNAEVPGFIPSERDVGTGRRRRDHQGAPVGSSSPASPRTCTACSRCSTPPSRPTGTSRSSAVRWCATCRSPASSGCCTCRDGAADRPRRGRGAAVAAGRC